MPTASFNFNFKPNISLQVGDIMYYINTTTVTGTSGGDSFSTGSQENIVRVGKVLSITENSGVYTISCNVEEPFSAFPTPMPYMFFAKDSKFNTGSLIGYFARVKFVSDSIEKGDKKGELFSATCDTYDSSK